MCWAVAYDLMDISLLWFYLKHWLLLVIQGFRHDDAFILALLGFDTS
jgi:hypothetical protein